MHCAVGDFYSIIAPRTSHPLTPTKSFVPSLDKHTLCTMGQGPNALMSNVAPASILGLHRRIRMSFRGKWRGKKKRKLTCGRLRVRNGLLLKRHAWKSRRTGVVCALTIARMPLSPRAPAMPKRIDGVEVFRLPTLRFNRMVLSSTRCYAKRLCHWLVRRTKQPLFAHSAGAAVLLGRFLLRRYRKRCSWHMEQIIILSRGKIGQLLLLCPSIDWFKQYSIYARDLDLRVHAELAQRTQSEQLLIARFGCNTAHFLRTVPPSTWGYSRRGTIINTSMLFLYVGRSADQPNIHHASY